MGRKTGPAGEHSEHLAFGEDDFPSKGSISRDCQTLGPVPESTDFFLEVYMTEQEESRMVVAFGQSMFRSSMRFVQRQHFLGSN